MANELYKEVKQFGGLKNDEEAKQISHEFFSDMRNFNYPDTGILGIQKILMPEIVATFLNPDLELDTGDTITFTGDSITATTHSGIYVWNHIIDTKWDLFEWS
jgi:hypothetical protein